MPPLSLLIKPSSGNCNLRCRYCFYHSIAENRDVKSYGFMSEDTLEVMVKKAFEYASISCTFAFQGGEPTLIGLPFYQKLIQLQKKYNVKKIKVNNAIQTNGILIDEKWAEFLHENDFLVGLSLDGTKEINDINRVYANGDGSFNQIMKTVKLFNDFKVEYNVLFVVTALTAKHSEKIYNFFSKNNFNYIQFIPCLDPLNEQRGDSNYSLTPKLFTNFLKTMFDFWYRDIKNGKLISIRYFDNLLGMFAGHPPEACGMSGVCQCQFVVEADGSVYPCDFYVLDRWKIGNIATSGFDEMRNSDTAKTFIKDSFELHTDCKQCNWLNICRGGCRRDRDTFDGSLTKSYFCQSYKDFFEYSVSRFQELRMLIFK